VDDWIKAATENSPTARRTATIQLLDYLDNSVKRYRLTDAYISQVTYGTDTGTRTLSCTEMMVE
jgi:hypothetical protein